MHSHKKRIPANANVAYSNWEMPDLTGVKRRIAQRLSELEKEQQAVEEAVNVKVVPKPPTLEEIEAIKAAAYAEGHASGVQAGQEEGYQAGFAQGQQEGEQAGQETGFQAGYQQGLDSSAQEISVQLERLKSIIQQLQGPLAGLDLETEASVLSLVDLICRALLRREIKLDRSHLSQIVKEAFQALPVGHQRLRILLNPEDLNLVEAACADLLEDYRLVADPEITLGGVKVETLQSLVDSTLESRYKKIIEELLNQAYSLQKQQVEALSMDVLATPDSTPLIEQEFAPDINAQADQAEDLAQLDDDLVDLDGPLAAFTQQEAHAVQPQGLTRGKAPKHLATDSINTSTEQEALSELADLDSALVQADMNAADDLVDLSGPANTFNDSISDSSSLDENLDNLTDLSSLDDLADSMPELSEFEFSAEEDGLLNQTQNQELESEVTPENTVAEDLALDDFETLLMAAEEDGAGVDALNIADTEGNAADAENLSLAESSNQEDLSVEENLTASVTEQDFEEDKEVESVHEDRYLDNLDVLENTWLDDLQETPPASLKPLNEQLGD